MKVFFKTEFKGMDRDLTIVSIGLCSETGEQFYAEFTDYDKTQCSPWTTYDSTEYFWKGIVQEPNVQYVYGTKTEIKTQLLQWFAQFSEVELVSDVGCYDMFLLMDIFGDFFDVPRYIAATYYDINQNIALKYNTTLMGAMNISRCKILTDNNIIIEGSEHTSLYQAKKIKEVFKCLNKK